MDHRTEIPIYLHDDMMNSQSYEHLTSDHIKKFLKSGKDFRSKKMKLNRNLQNNADKTRSPHS